MSDVTDLQELVTLTEGEETKEVEIQLSAMTRLEYRQTIKVPKIMDSDTLTRLVDKCWEEVDASVFNEDTEFFDRATCDYTEL